jgi:hypothetical protein
MAIQINDDFMTLTVDDRVVTTARFKQHVAANGNGTWVLATYLVGLFSGNQSVAASRSRP